MEGRQYFAALREAEAKAKPEANAADLATA
jgi:hypothetical protein